ncbi:hypothetical protein D3C87_279660 [compost metagenome]
MKTTVVQKKTINQETFSRTTVFVGLFVAILFTGTLVEYFNIPDKPVCFDTATTYSTPGKFNPYFVECSKK